jgi:carboxypeptidase Taq
MPDPQTTYRTLIANIKEISVLRSTNSLLGWDERTQMPAKGTAHRANQTALISRLSHERFTAPQVGDQLAELEQSNFLGPSDSEAATNVREIRRVYDRMTKVPAALVEEMGRTEVLGQQAWVEARKKSNFATFRPWLEKTLDLRKQEAACVGYQGSPYNALLEKYEPHETVEGVNAVFQSLRGPLVELIHAIGDSAHKAPVEILQKHYPTKAQEQLSREAASRIGYDFGAGRLDVAVHPFCADIGPGDVRLTTRYDENDFGSAFFSVLHEAGHGLYEQGLPAQDWGTPCGDYISLGIHESQSRLWENFIGRGRSFWKFFLPRAQELFPQNLRGVSADEWYFAINDVRPSFIRTESDEATYNLHVLLRYELEQAMISGDLAVADVPGAWNETMRKYLGITPPDDARGCLQDIHWSGGAFGYFPTYTLGNLYAAQFFQQAHKDIGDLDARFAAGDFAPMLIWLRQNIHRHGQRYTASQLVQRVTGKPLSAQPLLDHLHRKALELYHV